MSTNFKYVTEERYQTFVDNMELMENAVEEISSQPGLMRMLNSRSLSKGWTKDKALITAETLLHFFAKEERYEQCQSIIDAWPELKYNQ